MEDIRRTTNTIYRGTQENQAYVTSSQGKMKRRKSVEAKEINFQPSSQMMVASNTSPRTTIDQRVAIEDSNKAAIKKQELACKYSHYMRDEALIINTALDIEKEHFHREDELSPCRFVIKKLNLLAQTFDYHDGKHNDLITQHIGPYYSKHIDSALNYFKYKFASGCSWEHCKELNAFVKHFNVHPKDTPHLRDHTKTLKGLYKTAIETELNYIEYIKNYPFMANRIENMLNLKFICSTHSCAYNNKFITEKDIRKYTNLQRIQQTQRSMVSDSGNEKTDSSITQQLDYLDSKQSSECPISSNDRRIYNCLLSDQLTICKRSVGRDMNLHDRAYTLKNLANMCCKYNNIINDLHYLSNFFSSIAQAISLEALIAIEGKAENEYPLKEEILSYIFTLGKNNHLNKNCEDRYARCSQPQTVMTTESLAEHTFQTRLDEIGKILNNTKPVQYLKSASMLKELLNEKEEVIMQMIAADSAMKRVTEMKRILYIHLFQNIFHSYNKCTARNMGDYEITQTLSMHKSQFIECNPHTFILKKDGYRYDWCKIGCFILYNEISKLFKKKKIYEKDIEVLLLIKTLDPRLPNNTIRKYIKRALNVCLQSIKNNVGLISSETANEFSLWLEMLNNEFNIVNNLHKKNNQKKLANPTQAPHCPPLAQSTYDNQFPPIPMMPPPYLAAQHPVQASYQHPKTQQHPLFQPIIHHAEDRQENPLSLAIQQIRMNPLDPSMRLELLEPDEYDDTPMPIRNIHLQSHPEYPYLPSPLSPIFPTSCLPPPLYQDISRQQASYQQQVALCRAMPHQYHPMDSPNSSER